jgi:hypothetical protein
MVSVFDGVEVSDVAEVPMWAAVFGIVALSSPPRVALSLVGGVGVIAVALMLLPLSRRSRPAAQQTKGFGGNNGAPRIMMVAARTPAVGTAMTSASMSEAGNAIDLWRLEDDGG